MLNFRFNAESLWRAIFWLNAIGVHYNGSCVLFLWCEWIFIFHLSFSFLFFFFTFSNSIVGLFSSILWNTRQGFWLHHVVLKFILKNRSKLIFIVDFISYFSSFFLLIYFFFSFLFFSFFFLNLNNWLQLVDGLNIRSCTTQGMANSSRVVAWVPSCDRYYLIIWNETQNWLLVAS